ncbi:MAG: inorganic phosphate transporter [Candidatus Cloacimonas sp.]|jgi:PiT family inorganic phosphate transporter|nr:inorganic phosphate transporter [Candidatus Cloacimonas sp.]
MVFIYLFSGLFLGWSFGAKDTGNIFGAAVETKMITFRKAALIAAIFVTLGAVLDGSGPSQTLSRLGEVNALGGAFTVALAAAATITLMVRIGIPVATSQTLAGAIIGWNYFAGRLTDYSSLATIAGSWVLAPVLGAVFAAILFFLFRAYLGRVKIHLLEQDVWTRFWLVIIGAFGAYSLGANNIANIVGVFVPVNPFRDVQIPFFGTLTGVTQLFLLGSASIVVGIYTYSHKIMRTVGKNLFHLSPITALIAVLSEAIVLFIFSSKALYGLLVKVGLPPIPLVPVSASQIIVGSVLGIGLAKGGKNIRYNMLGKILFAWITAPVIAFFFSFVALFIIQNVFEQTVNLESHYVFDRYTIMQIKDSGLDSDHLSTVNGRVFDNENVLYKQLKESGNFTKEQLLQIIQITQIHPTLIDTKILEDQGLQVNFTQPQWDALTRLNGRIFRHKWLLAAELAKTPAWKKMQTVSKEADEKHNSELDSKLAILYRNLYHPEK